MRYLILSALAAASIATPAMAQSADADATFTGPRFEALAGWDHFGNDRAGTKDGVVYGGAIGYDMAMGGAVIGAEAELTDSSANVRGSNLLAAGDSSRLSPGRDIYVGARVGTMLTPQTLLYAKAGYTNARINSRYTNAAAVTVQDHQNLDGYRVGAGIEYAPATNWYVKAEYRYSKYGDYDRFSDIRPSRNQVVAGVGLRF